MKMMSGPAFLRENFATVFDRPLKTPHTLIKMPHPGEAAAIAGFFNADNYTVRRRWKWDADKDYKRKYIAQVLIKHMSETEKESNKLTLNIYNPDRSLHIGYLEFFAAGPKAQPHLFCYLLPSYFDVDIAEEAHVSTLSHAEKHGLVTLPPYNLRQLLRSQFEAITGGAVITERLIIRPYKPEDDDQLQIVTDIGQKNIRRYHTKEMAGIQRGILYVGLFARQDHSLLGQLSFWQDENALPRMSYSITATERGKGLASEAHRACMAWTDSFLTIPITRAEIEIGNDASEAVLRKSGFQRTEEIRAVTYGFEGVSMIRMERLYP